MGKHVDETEVDLYALDKEWAKQSSIRRKAGEEQSDVADEVRRKKSYIKYRTAQIALEYNTGKKSIEDSEGKVIKKPSVGAIKSAVESDEELFTLDKELNDLQKNLDICANYTTALDVKKYALQDEVKLYLAGYFAEPTDVSRKGGDYVREMNELKEKQEEMDNREELRKRRRKKKDE